MRRESVCVFVFVLRHKHKHTHIHTQIHTHSLTHSNEHTHSSTAAKEVMAFDVLFASRMERGGPFLHNDTAVQGAGQRLGVG